MKKIAWIVAAAVSFSIVLASPASAATVFHESFHGTVAQAYWVTEIGTDVVSADVAVGRGRLGPILTVFDVITHHDADGRFAGSSFTVVDVRTGFSLSIDASLSGARVNGSDLPAMTCSYDANELFLGCTNSTVDVRARWTGVGAITHEVSTAHFHAGGFTSVYHQNGRSRDATATGTVNGVVLTLDDLVVATLAANTGGSLEVCTEASC
jgi:hypothetical protein